MAEDRLHDAVAAGALAGPAAQSELLRSIVDVARAIFVRQGGLDARRGERRAGLRGGLGRGLREPGRPALPRQQGIAGWVATAGQPLVLDDVSADPRFAADVAEGTGCVPKVLMAPPLIRDDEVIGVPSVLDRSDAEAFGLAQMELLELFSRQAAIALGIVQSARAAGPVEPPARVLPPEDDHGVVRDLHQAPPRLGTRMLPIRAAETTHPG